jgi:hypothetical protein
MAVDWGEVEQTRRVHRAVSATDMLVSLQSGRGHASRDLERSLSELAGSGEIALFRSGDRVDILAGDANADRPGRAGAAGRASPVITSAARPPREISG